MRPLPAALAFLALLGAVVAVGLLWLGEGPRPLPQVPTGVPERTGTAGPGPGAVELPRGGIFEGRVVDAAGKGIPGATVLLVELETGRLGDAAGPADPDVIDPSLIASVEYRTAGTAKTDAAGRFRVAADADDAIRMVAAHRRGYAPGLVMVDGPQEGILVRLLDGGVYVGTVLDADTKQPVSGAEVAIYLQQRVTPPVAPLGETGPGATHREPLSAYAVAQRWVARELGPLVWGLDWRGDETLRTWTDKNGVFRLSEIPEAVQLEFVVSHPDYAWVDVDQAEGATRVARTTVEPGRTVERTFLLPRGKRIAGRVLDENGRGVPDVQIAVDHVAQYHQHWWYRVKKRMGRTRSDGRFEVGGLSFGPYTVELRHPAFGTEFIPSVPEGSTDLVFHVENLGALDGHVEGLADTGVLRKATLLLEKADEEAGGARSQRFDTLIASDGSFSVPGIQPGRWRAWIQVMGRASLPQLVEVRSLERTRVEFELGGGGRVVARVLDGAGRIVDPATVLLVRLGAGEGAEQRLGQFVSRGGDLLAEGVAPGRYRLEAQAPGYLPAGSEPFDVVRDGRTDAGDLVLRRLGTLAIEGIVGPDGRGVEGAVHLSLKEGDGEERSLPMLTGPEVLVRPGAVVLRAVADDGSHFEATYQVADGERIPVTIRLSR